MKKLPLLLTLVCVLVWAALPAAADVKPSSLFSDDMVLQRDIAVPVWGAADADEQVTVSVAGKTAKATASAEGKWMVRLPAMPAGGPYEMTIQGKNTITLKNVMVGEVWICSGQSNMQMTVGNSNDAKEEIAAAKHANIRLYSVPLKAEEKPLADCNSKWVVCSPETIPNFTAVGYFFGRHLQKDLNVAVGLINTSWGGTPAESWTKESEILGEPATASLVKEYNDSLAKFDAAKAEADFKKAVAKYKEAAAKAKAEGKEAPKPPRKNEIRKQNRPGSLYNGMIAPLLPYAIRGAIWYQGESNSGRAEQYRTLLPLMIKNWRTDWKQGDFPFGVVQLANYMSTHEEPADTNWARLRDAQLHTAQTVPNTGLAVIIDIGNPKDIHPKNKQDVGKRLALWALAKAYGKDLVYSGPIYKSMDKKGSAIVLHFDHVGGGLVAKGGELKGFALAGADKNFAWANAKIEGDTVVVSSDKVSDPVAVRYAWDDDPVCNLINKEGLCATPFHTDDWPQAAPKPAAPAPKAKAAK